MYERRGQSSGEGLTMWIIPVAMATNVVGIKCELKPNHPPVCG